MKKINYILFLLLLFTEGAWAQSNWEFVGPVNRTNPSSPNGQGSGRIYSIAHHPQYNGTTIKTVFGASPYGGVWISKNAGVSWSNTDADYPDLSTDKLNGCGVMDIIVDHTNPYVLYAASYHQTGIGFMGTSAGIWKYTKTSGTIGGWSSTGLSWSYPSPKQMYKLTMHPGNNQVILAGTSDGIYRTSNGGANWTLVFAHTTANNYGFKNIVFRPGNSNEVYASADKVYKSIDAGITWTVIANFPVANADWVDIAVTSAGNFYCAFISPTGYHFYYYTASNSIWTSKSTLPIHYEWNIKRLTLTLHPTNSNIVYAGQELLHRYDLSNNTWTPISDYNGNMHADMHEITFSPNNTELWIGHDGGISMANANLTSGTPNWSTKNTGLAIATIYSFSGSPKEPSKYLAGEEDNGNSYYNGGAWQGYGVADGGDKMIDHDNPNNWYDREEMYAHRTIYRNTTGIPGYSGTGVTTVFDRSNTQPFVNPGLPYYEDFGVPKPLIQDPRNPNVVYKAGINGLWRSSNYGTSAEAILMAGCIIGWGQFVTSVAIAPSNPNYIYVNGFSKYDRTVTDKVLMTHNALSCPYFVYDVNTQTGSCSDPSAMDCSCSCWTDITPPWPTSGYTTAQLSQNNINTVVVSDKDPDKIWIGYKRTSSVAADRTTYQIKMRENGAWTDYNTGLPANADIFDLIYERGSNDGLYAATTAGIYYRNADASEWTLFDTNLPRAEVRKMEINYSDNTIRAGLYGRGIWKSALQCPAQNLIDFPNMGIAPNFYEAKYITAGNNSLTTSNAATVFRATNSIILSPNFIAEALPGGSFLAYIHGCSGPGNSFAIKYDDEPETITENEEEEYESNEENFFQATPNPGNGLLNLTFQNEDEKNIFIYDMMGKVIFKEERLRKNILQVDISNQPKGIYLVKVISGEKIISQKIIIQ